METGGASGARRIPTAEGASAVAAASRQAVRSFFTDGSNNCACYKQYIYTRMLAFIV